MNRKMRTMHILSTKYILLYPVSCFNNLLIKHFWDNLVTYLYILENLLYTQTFLILVNAKPTFQTETEPTLNARAENRMKSNHYGQKLAGFRVLCVPYCYALLYRRRANYSNTEGGWQSCVIEADRASGGWPSRAVLFCWQGLERQGRQ